MGAATLDFHSLPPDIPTDHWLDLDEDTDKKAGLAKKELGRIHLKLMWHV